MALTSALPAAEPGIGDEQFIEFLYCVPVGVCNFDRGGRIHFANPFIAQSLVPIAGVEVFDDVWLALEAMVPNLRGRIPDKGPASILDSHRVYLDGRSSGRDPVATVVYALTLKLLSTGTLMLSVDDVTADHEKAVELAVSQAKMNVIVGNAVGYGIFTVDQHSAIDTWNLSGERMFGLSGDEAIGQPLWSLLDEPDIEGTKARMRAEADSNGWTLLTSIARGADDRRFRARIVVSPLHRPCGPTGYIVVFRDLATSDSARSDLEHAAYTDPLTGLANRRHFLEAVPRLQGSLGSTDTHGAIAIIDLDRFKAINDTFGHDAGDHVLQETATRIQAVIRETDLACRLGGEEFAVFVNAVHTEATARTAGRLWSAVRERPYGIGEDRELAVTGSLGFATVTRAGPEGLQEALKAADRALYRAKENGRDRIECADPAASAALLQGAG